jgi:hypothetical protein
VWKSGPEPRRFLASAAALLLACTGTACVGVDVPLRHDPRYRRVERLPAPEEKPYTLAAGDVLALIVVGHPEFSDELVLSPEGDVLLPTCLDRVVLAGTTLPEASRLVAGKLSPYTKVFPRVIMRVIESSGRICYVVGAVRFQGKYRLDAGRTSLREVLLRANAGREVAEGGRVRFRLNEVAIPGDADLARTHVIAPGRDTLRYVVRDAGRLLFLGDLAQDVVVGPEMTVFVPSRSSPGRGLPAGLASGGRRP